MPLIVLESTQPKLFSTFSKLTIAFFVSQRALHGQECTSLVRPLLALNRCETGRLCQLWGMPIYPDRTNQELLFSRNRVRKQLLPTLRAFFNPQADVVLSNLSEVLLLERLYTEFLYGKLSRNIKDWDALPRGGRPLIYPIQWFWQAKNVVRAAGDRRPSLRVCDCPTHANNRSRHKILAKGVNTKEVYRAVGNRLLVSIDSTLHHDKSPLNTRLEGCEPLPFIISEGLLEQLERQHGEDKKCGLPSRIEEKRMLPPSLRKKGRKALQMRMATRLGKIHFDCKQLHSNRGSHPPRSAKATNHEGGRTAFKTSCKKGNYKECLSNKKKFVCRPIASTPMCCHPWPQYFYFPKAGGFIIFCAAAWPSLKIEENEK